LKSQTTTGFWTIPNILSLYRISIFPFILWLIIRKEESQFAVFITISLVTDILDGLIARTFKMESAIGVKLDSWADTGTYILAFIAIYLFKWPVLQPYSWILWLFVICWIVSYIVVFSKFGGLLGLHTYLFKITGYLQGAFIVSLFLWGFSKWLFYIALSVGIIACIEEIAIFLLLTHPQSNVKGLYWIVKKRSA